MSGFDVKKLPNIKRSGQFSDLVDIFQNGQRQGVMVFRSGSGLAFSSPRPPLAKNTPTATDRSFFPPPKPSPFPFDRKIHKTMGFVRPNQQLTSISGHTGSQQLTTSTSPFTPSAPFATNFPPSTTQNSFSFPLINNQNNGLQSAPPLNSAGQQVNFNSFNNADLKNMVENFGLNSVVAPNPEQLMIQVVNQQKLHTSNGPVEQKPFKPKKPKRPKNKKKPKKVVENAENLVTELRRQGKTAIGPSLSFAGNTINDFRTGRQTNTDKVVVPSFPNGLPNGTPEGVKVALASAVRGKNCCNNQRSRIIERSADMTRNLSGVELHDFSCLLTFTAVC